MQRVRGLLALLLAVVLVSAPLSAQTGTAPKKKNVQVQFQQFTLKNGLRVILSEDHSAPTYSIVVNYDVGSRNEKPGRSGFAHLFEHMMFQGSQNVGKGEHFILVENNGGGVNGTTNNDRTVYFETMPANQIDLGLFIEADRMRALNVTQGNLDNQRNAVQEERRRGIDNQPYGPTFLALDELMYDNYAYKHSVIGTMEDLNAASLEDVKDFFRIYYAPNNAVLVLVGDFKTQEALTKVKKYFEDIPSQPKPASVDMTEPAQTAERRKTIEDGFARAALLNIFFKVPPGSERDWYALDVAGDVLVRGQSSRLYQKLVREKQVAVNIGGGPDRRRGQSRFTFQAVLRPGANPAEVEKMIWEEINRLKNEPPSEVEIAKIAMQNRRQRVQGLVSTLSRGIQLSEAAIAAKDPNRVNSEAETYDSITAKDVQRAAQTYWKESAQNVIVTVPKPPAAAPAGAKQ